MCPGIQSNSDWKGKKDVYDQNGGSFKASLNNTKNISKHYQHSTMQTSYKIYDKKTNEAIMKIF